MYFFSFWLAGFCTFSSIFSLLWSFLSLLWFVLEVFWHLCVSVIKLFFYVYVVFVVTGLIIGCINHSLSIVCHEDSALDTIVTECFHSFFGELIAEKNLDCVSNHQAKTTKKLVLVLKDEGDYLANVKYGKSDFAIADARILYLC